MSELALVDIDSKRTTQTHIASDGRNLTFRFV